MSSVDVGIGSGRHISISVACKETACTSAKRFWSLEGGQHTSSPQEHQLMDSTVLSNLLRIWRASSKMRIAQAKARDYAES